MVLGFLEVGLFRPISLTMTTAKICMLYIDELHSVLPHVVGEKVIYIYHMHMYIYIYTYIVHIYSNHVHVRRIA